MNVTVVVEKVTGHVIVMKEEDLEVEVILQEEDILHVDLVQDLEVTQVDLVQEPDQDPDPDPDPVRAVQDLEVILDPTLVIVEVEEDLEAVHYVVQEVTDLVLTQEIDHTHQDLNPHVQDQEVDQDQILKLHRVPDLVLDLVHTVVPVPAADLAQDPTVVPVLDLIPDHHR